MAELVRHVDAGLPRNQRVNQFVVDAVHRPVDRPRAVRLRLVHVGAGLDHAQRGGAPAFLDRRRQPGGLRLGQQRHDRGNQQDSGDENETLHPCLRSSATAGVGAIAHTTSGSSLLWFPHSPRAAA
ncbi:hypothetical protein D3C83_18820 [compost metagenome]